MTFHRDADMNSRPHPFNAARISERSLDELIGACRGVLADGAVTAGEAKFLLDFIETNRGHCQEWPANVLYGRLTQMLVDHSLDPQEEGELLELLHEIVGGPAPVEKRIASYSSSLPLCKPQPRIEFPGKKFCLTGKFLFGSRTKCEGEVTLRGGIRESAPTRTTSFLVIGAMGSPDWIHSTHGRKIQAAVELRSEGLPIHVVSEESWTLALQGN